MLTKYHILSDAWTLFREFVYVSTVFDISIDDLILSPGIMYRVVLKLCASTICFQTIKTDGVMVMANPPTKGSINVEHRNTTQTGGAEKVYCSYIIIFLFFCFVIAQWTLPNIILIRDISMLSTYEPI